MAEDIKTRILRASGGPFLTFTCRSKNYPTSAECMTSQFMRVGEEQMCRECGEVFTARVVDGEWVVTAHSAEMTTKSGEQHYAVRPEVPKEKVCVSCRRVYDVEGRDDAERRNSCRPCLRRGEELDAQDEVNRRATLYRGMSQYQIQNHEERLDGLWRSSMSKR